MKDFIQFILILLYWAVSAVLRYFVIQIFSTTDPLWGWGIIICSDIAVYRWWLDHWQTRKLWGYIAAVLILIPTLCDIFVALFLLFVR